MPREAILPSVALAQLLRNKRKELGLTLQEISEQSITAGDFIPASTLARIEQGKSDPGVRRVHRLLRLYNVLPQFAADMVELENLAVAPLRYRDLETLHDEGIKAWERGDIATGLAHLFAVREFVPADESSRKLRQKATISFADFAMSLGKYRLAKQLVDDLLLDDPASEFLLPLFVLQADIWRALGSVPNAVAFIRQAETIVEPGNRREEASVYYQMARLLLDAKDYPGAQASIDRAIDSFRTAGDVYGEGRALILRVSLHAARGDSERAHWQAREAIKAAEKKGHARLEVLGKIALAQLLLSEGEAATARDVLEEALGQAVMIKDGRATFLAHHSLWKASLGMNDSARADVELDACRYFVKFVDEVSKETIEIRALLMDDTERPGAPNPAPARSKRPGRPRRTRR